ncbi:helix-turn-helix domain-containing protein [Paenibacillus elgii]|uniref:helix-turn-helix domain-containing protein n=1 Tax=Paenibacillus elgii TaxID=189691 RepID=UPI00203DBCB1|nr:helix-turn-helix transcriptional regulator [Paenibacillus elgii]MCM3271160.1 helix-turn-helix domain-containing protein [Paenibacillus elgii]
MKIKAKTNAIVRARIVKGMTQRDLAQLSGLSYAYISLLERSVKAVGSNSIINNNMKAIKEKVSTNRMFVTMWKNGSAQYEKEYIVNTDVVLTDTVFPGLVIIKEARLSD